MKKTKDVQSLIVVQKFRVECNRGSKYFTNDNKASAYLDYMTASGFDAQLWLVRHFYDENGTLVKGDQQLLESEAAD